MFLFGLFLKKNKFNFKKNIEWFRCYFMIIFLYLSNISISKKDIDFLIK